jgi:SAM-dependent methyltransferase
MKNLVLFIKNINNYGIITFFKIIFFEILYTIKNFDFKSLKYEPFQNDEYELTKKNKIYNTPYIPTPFYFLKIICIFFKKLKKDNLLILDLGCGYSRVQYFFSSYFNSLFIGADINKKIIDDLKKKKIKKSNFLNINLRRDKDLDLLINKTQKIKMKRDLLIFFSDSFDVDLLKKVLKNFSNKFNFYCILVNVRNTSFLSKKYDILFNKEFKNPQRNIKVFKVNE